MSRSSSKPAQPPSVDEANPYPTMFRGRRIPEMAEFMNIRPPALTTFNVIKTPEEYCTVAIGMGAMSSQVERPDKNDFVEFCCDYGEALAEGMRRRGWSATKAK